MKTLNFFLILLVNFMMTSCNEHPSDNGTKIAHQVMKKASVEIHNKFGLDGEGIIEAGPDKYTLIGLSFSRDGLLSKKEARILLLEVSNILLENINSDKRLQPHLSVYPFTEKNIEVSIRIRPSRDQKIFHPDIISFGQDQGEVYFQSRISPEDKYKSHFDKETYEEALKLVEEEYPNG